MMKEYEIVNNINKCKRKILGTRLFGVLILIYAFFSYMLELHTDLLLFLVIPLSLIIIFGVGLPAMLSLSKLKKELAKIQRESN